MVLAKISPLIGEKKKKKRKKKKKAHKAHIDNLET